VLFPALEAQNIRFIRRSDWNASQQAWLKKYFEERIAAHVLSPMRAWTRPSFSPRILNKSLNFIISLAGKDASAATSNWPSCKRPAPLLRITPTCRRVRRNSGPQ